MPRMLRIAAATFVVAATAVIGWSVRRYSYGLSFLPESQTSFDLKPFIVEAVLSYGLLLAGVVSVFFILMALASIVERLQVEARQRPRPSDETAPVPAAPAGRPPIRMRVSPRMMRIGAVVVIVAAVAVAILQMRLWSLAATSQQMLHDTYFLVGGTGSAVALVLIVGAIALVMVTLATILQRLDDMQGRSTVSGNSPK